LPDERSHPLDFTLVLTAEYFFEHNVDHRNEPRVTP
jgi:hypothetical protein